jgi:hypothetical protein
MGFCADLKTKRAAKKAQAVYELEVYEWNLENTALTSALDTAGVSPKRSKTTR